MTLDELAKRLEAAEREIKALREWQMTALGEATFAGLTVPALIALLLQSGALDEAGTRTALDGLLLLLEREQGGRAWLPPEALQHARSRVEAALEFLPPVPPEPR